MNINSQSVVVNYKINASKTLEDAMIMLNESGTRILVVVEDDKVIGTVTDGDIRRALINKEGPDTTIDQVMNRNYVAGNVEEENDELLNKMIENKIQTIPVITSNGDLAKVITMTDIISQRRHQGVVLIMAGGKGTRLGNLTKSCPKPMLRINGTPMLEIIIEQYKKEGFRKFLLSVNYLKEKIIDYFGTGERLGVNIDYIVESRPLGTAGSLGLIKESINEPLLVINGDVLSTTSGSDLIRSHVENGVKATICVREVETNINFGVVNEEMGKLKDIVEKPTIKHKVNAGIYVINPEITNLIGDNEFIDMPDFLKRIVEEGEQVAVETINEYWLDIGRPETLEEAEMTWTTTLRSE